MGCSAGKHSAAGNVKGCSVVNAAQDMTPVVDAEGIVSQWVESVTQFSSEYDSKSWPARCVVGSPKVYPKYGDISGAWAPKCIDSKQFLELEFKEAVYVTKIDIYETYYAGGVVAVKGLDNKGVWQPLWTAEKPSCVKSSRVFSPKLNMKVLNCPTRNIRLNIDCMAAKTWVEIDAVQLHGRRHVTDAAEAMVPRELSSLSKTSSMSDEPGLVLNDKDTSDCQFLVCGKDVVYAHKDIICQRSDYFKELFADSGQVATNEKDQREINDVTYTGFMGVLHSIYNFSLPEVYTALMLVDVWRVAERYKMPALVSEIDMAIKQKVDENNVIEVYQASTNTPPVLEFVSNYCKQYMMENMEKVVNAPNFTSLPFDIMAYPY